MIEDISLERRETSLDFETHPSGVYVEMYDGNNYVGMPLTIEGVRKVRDYLNAVIDEMENEQ